MSERIEVWAPFAGRVELRLGADEATGETVAMEQGAHGYWTAEISRDLSHTPYAFVLDGGAPRPDPRSERQPQGVHGPSLRVRHEEFTWSDAGFQQPPLSASVIYELHVGTFTEAGTLDAAAEHLDELVTLGVTHVELMPLATASGRRGWGYDGVDLYAPHEAYGGPEAVKRFVDAAHGRGLAVLLDVVYNHLGPEGNYLREFGPYFTERYQTPWGAAVNLDGAGSDEVRAFFIDNATMWLRDYHFDGLRIDAVHAFYDTSAVNFLEELGLAVEDLERELGRRLVVIAESDLNDPRVVRSREVGGYGLDAQWSDDFHHALHALLTGERGGYYADYGRLSQVAYALENTFIFDGRRQSSRGRRHGRPAADLPPERFLGYIQNHDQVGNRARGERLSHIAGKKRQKVAAALCLLSPFVPMIFQGEEWAASTPFLYFTDHEDAGLGEAVREGRKSEFDLEDTEIPDPQAPETARASVLRRDERSHAPHSDVLRWYRELVRLRREVPDLAGGTRREMRVDYDEAAGTLVLSRGRVRLICNVSEDQRSIEVASAASLTVLAASEPAMEQGLSGESSEPAAEPQRSLLSESAVRLPPLSALVVQSRGH
ncbi:MAG: malto-oligosyltrehalose trehalohydrolase [Spirochaetota bacterium]